LRRDDPPEGRFFAVVEVLDLKIGEPPVAPKPGDGFPAGLAEGRRELLLGDF
jgi:hypothetical protein